MTKSPLNRFALFIVLLVMVACNFPLSRSSRMTSFDAAHLMMLTSRALMDLYEPLELASIPQKKSGVTLAALTIEDSINSSLEDLNQEKALAAEYQRLANIARQAGDEEMAVELERKVRLHLGNAQIIEMQRQSWRRSHRFDSVIRRTTRQIGYGIGQVINMAGQMTADTIVYQVKNYGDEIKRFIRNPARYLADIALDRQLDIIKQQFVDRLGPFVGNRVFELLGISRAAWNLENQIFGPEIKPTEKPSDPEKTTEAATETETATEAVTQAAGDTAGSKMILATGSADLDPSYLDGRLVVTANRATLSFPLEGGAAVGEVVVSYTQPQQECPNSTLTFTYPLNGEYAVEGGFTGSAAERRTSHYFIYDKDEGKCYEFNENYVLSGRTFTWLGDLTQNGDTFDILLTMTEEGAASENTGTIHLTGR